MCIEISYEFLGFQMKEFANFIRQIGWSKLSTKIVIFATDGLIHFAGDGLLAGVVKKNDQVCKLSSNGEYLAALESDYPSLEETYRALLRHKVRIRVPIITTGSFRGFLFHFIILQVNVIFAVTSDVLPVYDQIHQLIPEMSRIGILKMDSSNILQLVRDGYTDFIRKIQFFDGAPSNIMVTYETRCSNQYFSARQQAKCDNVEMGKVYEFTINITLIDYPKVRDDGMSILQQSFKIESGISSEYLQFDIEIQEECPCLVSQHEDEENSVACNWRGSLRCGMCFCENGWAGKACECDLQNIGNGDATVGSKQCRQCYECP